MLGSRINGGNTEYSRHDADFYPTPPEATLALINFLKDQNLLSDTDVVWEPACGSGDMSEVLYKSGIQVLSSDIRKTDYINQSFELDFVNDSISPEIDFDWIITNPPFSISKDFIENSFNYNVNFALLVKSQYWHAKSRLEIFNKTNPAYVLPLTWRPDFCFKNRGSGSPLMDVMWVVWVSGNKENCKYIPMEKPIIK